MVWQHFKTHMGTVHHDLILEDLCGTWHEQRQGEAAKGALTLRDKAVCELALKALTFKHRITLDAPSTRHTKLGTDNNEVDLYMRCILVNIFMKRILGEKCVQTAGGKRAFDAAQAFVDTTGTAERNSTCETVDMAPGGDRSKRPEDWTLLDIMGRWLERHKGYLRDGEQGVLGTECIVQKDKTAEHIKEEATKKIEALGTEIENTVNEILKEIDKSPEGKSMENIIKKVKQGKDSASTTPPEHGPSMPSSPDGQGREGAGDSGTAQTVSTPAPAKPAPAKPATAAKPEAAKPVPPATTTTSSGGGSGSSGSGGGPAGKGAAREKGKQAGTGDNCEWQSILAAPKRTVHVLRYYTSDELQKMKTALQAFIDYMQHHTDQMDAYGANCDNSGWDDFGHDHLHKAQTVADVIRCRLMTGALWFANGDNAQGKTAEGTSIPVDSTQTALRCEVANVFGYMLKNQYCKNEGTWKRGVEYAWKTMKKMGRDDKPGAVTIPGPVMDGRCTQCGYKGSMTQLGIINGHIVEWLLTEGIMEDIAQMERQMPCDKNWKNYKQEKGGTDHEVIEEAEIHEVTEIEKKVVEQTKKVIEKVKDKIDQEIAKGAGAAAAAKPAATKPAKMTQPVEESPGRSDPGAGDTTVVSQTGVGEGHGPGPGQQPPPPTLLPSPAALPLPPPPAGKSTDDTGEEECKDEQSSSSASGAQTHEGSLVSVTSVPYSYPGEASCEILKTIREHERATSSTGTCDSPQRSSRHGSAGGVDNVLDALC
ncbi:hypothetical protein AK88_04284 [Plasmodium fragile]|uniref:Schizont-infected cell agglutination extracellular alpha domain-containing protein n=1 Tax=Plasmodium fragile TaxID=5857 RepID=A0A0D9QGL0_PLAFR|nr:uncharacterized protein AK88_04284 [Plasmodium fragile]KJP86093.1 hypothetical protein AK88_04284 [Plasmodium fragile]